jgi:hypothetical protein
MEVVMYRVMRMRAGSLVSAMGPATKVRNAVPQTPAEKLAAEFSLLAGGYESALVLIDQLRCGALAPTGPMGWMDVKLSLVLVQELLGATGSHNPAPESLEAALRNVLALRADGMGWGRIAFMVGRQ